MFSRVRVAIRFFFLGLAVGVLLAPRSGQETRRMVRERADRLLNDLLDAATLGTAGSGGGEEDGGGGNDRASRAKSRSKTAAQA
jgi:gas vesicle protein